MNDNDLQFLQDIGLDWPPPDATVAGFVFPADIDARIAAKAGMSTRATASALGMSKDTVHRDRIVSSETMPDAVKRSEAS